MGLISVLAGRFPGGAAPTKLFRIDPKQLDFPHALISNQLASTMPSPTYGEE
jgi:hypothetical protein